jgi:hypothetical protein
MKTLVLVGTLLSSFSLLVAASPEGGQAVPIEAFGIVEERRLDSGRGNLPNYKARAEWAARPPLGFASNGSQAALSDRSLGRVHRQSCQSGYGYCSGMSSIPYISHRASSKDDLTPFSIRRLLPLNGRLLWLGLLHPSRRRLLSIRILRYWRALLRRRLHAEWRRVLFRWKLLSTRQHMRVGQV